MKTLSGSSLARERAIQLRLLATIERKYERQYRTEIKRATLAMIEASTGQEVTAAQETHRENIKRILMSNWNTTFNRFGERIIKPNEKSIWRNLETKDFMLDPATAYRLASERWAAKYGAARLTEVVGTTEKDAKAIVRRATAEAVADNLAEREAGLYIQAAIASKSSSISRLRSRVIARTETHTASQSASYEAAKATGINVKKRWSAAGQQGDRTRKTHEAADGQTVGIDDFFDVGGEAMLYPGDPDGSAENVINCRCINLIVPVE